MTAAGDAVAAAEAFAAAERLNKIKADSQAAVFAISAGRDRLKQGQIKAAVEKFREAVRLAPDNAQAHQQLGLALRRQGAVSEARIALETARRLAPQVHSPD
jgi:Flp pilus assembly protein TadD